MTNPTDPRVEAAALVLWSDGVWDTYTDRQKNSRKRIVANALKAADAAAWLSIETAPLHQEIIIAWKTGTVSVGTKYGTGWKFSNGDEMYGVHAALGWQPLPKSP